jgi:acyl-CoA thioester hydrolase
MAVGEPRDTHLVPELAWDAERERHVGRLTLRVRYAETDKMGFVYNANYLTWFEIGRTEFMRSLGTSYRSVEERGFLLPLVEASLRVRLPARYDDTVAIETWIERIRSRTLTFGYRVLRGTAVAAAGSTIHACVRAADGRSGALPDWLRDLVRGPAS